MKRIAICLILTSMALHCAGRLGILSSLYAQRYQYAFAFGMIDEIPIAVCDSKTDVHKNLYVATDDASHETPAKIMHASEINLFVEIPLALEFDTIDIPITGASSYSLHIPTSPTFEILQPPKA